MVRKKRFPYEEGKFGMDRVGLSQSKYFIAALPSTLGINNVHWIKLNLNSLNRTNQ